MIWPFQMDITLSPDGRLPKLTDGCPVTGLPTPEGDGTAKVSLDGTAKNFNALAVQSNTVAADMFFKSAIFSGIAFDTNGRIKFKLTADIDPSLIHITQKQALLLPAAAAGAPPTAPALPVATTTPAATTSNP